MREIEWQISQGLVEYPEAVAAMERRIRAIEAGEAAELIWLLEHPPLYTAGTSAREGDLIDTKRFPVYASGRGGQYTYHGPGQRIAYVMLDLKRRDAMDVRAYVQQLERWLIEALARFGVEAFTREGRVGVWTYIPSPCRGEDQGGGKLAPTESVAPSPPLPPAGGGRSEAKIAALGIRIRKWVTYHGISLNVNPDLSHYAGIVPCGISEHGVTSLAALGVSTSMTEVDAVLRESFGAVFT